MSDQIHEAVDAGAAPRCAWFDGILEGPRPDDAAWLEQQIERCNETGVVRLELDHDGGRFTVLADDGTITGPGLDDDRRGRFVEMLDELVRALPGTGGVESTLRCTDFLGNEVRETLFAVRGGGVQPLSRQRPVTREDHARASREADLEQDGGLGFNLPQSRRLILACAILLFIGIGLTAWQSGAIHGLFAASAADLETNTGPFNQMLTVELTQKWGAYEVVITRGAAYPETTAAVDEALNAAVTTADRAAVNVLANGDEVYVRLYDRADKRVVARSVSLRPLLTDPKGKAKLELPGHMAAKRVELALDAGTDDKP